MPELPEVQTVVNTLAPRVVGAVIRSVDLRRQDVVTPAGFDLPANLVGRTIRRIDRRGKRIVLLLDDGNQFYIHLGMTGRLTLESAAAEVLKHTHLLINFAASAADLQLRFRDARRFGGIWWMGLDGSHHSIGAEPLEITANELATQLKRTRRAIKTALLDQRLLAGLGNIYADEALHAAKIHPAIRADHLKRGQVERLTKAIKTVLRRALRHRGSTLRDYVDADGVKGGFQKLHRVYDRTGQPCLICGTPIKRIILGGRSTHFCPNCQSKRLV